MASEGGRNWQQWFFQTTRHTVRLYFNQFRRL